MSRYLLLLGTLFTVWSAPAIGIAQKSKQAEPACVRADAELNRTYKQVRQAYKDNPLFLQKLTLAQRAWIKFRDAHMESRYPVKAGQSENLEYGSVFGQCHCEEVAELIKARTAQLRRWLEGVEEGEGCSGSYKFEHQLE